MCHCEQIEVDEYGDIDTMSVDNTYELLSLNCKMLTVNEFAELYNVKPLTVRQWIRRGKLRAVKKSGRDWLISEMANPPRRGYESVTYSWSDGVDLPDEISEFAEYHCLHIFQNQDNKEEFNVYLGYPGSDKCKCLFLTKQECEKLELMLLSTDGIKAEEFIDCVQYIPAKEDKTPSKFSGLSDTNFTQPAELEYGAVLITKGVHKGRIGYYDDDSDKDKAIVYFGDIYITDGYYEIPYKNITADIPTINLTERMYEIFGEVNQNRGNTRVQKELLTEYIYCSDLLTERYINSMNMISDNKDTQIFISHATADMTFARTLATDIMNAGYKVFLDDWSIDIGDRLHDKINEGLDAGNALIMVISEKYLNSVYCKDEWSAFYKKAASNPNCLIYPIIIDDSEPPTLISTIKYARVDEYTNYRTTLNKLLKAMKKHFE